MAKEDFNSAGSKDETGPTFSHPEPKEILKQGITSRATIEWERRNDPTELSLDYTPDGSDWDEIKRELEEERQKLLDKKLEKFEQSGRDLAKEFGDKGSDVNSPENNGRDER